MRTSSHARIILHFRVCCAPFLGSVNDHIEIVSVVRRLHTNCAAASWRTGSPPSRRWWSARRARAAAEARARAAWRLLRGRQQQPLVTAGSWPPQ